MNLLHENRSDNTKHILEVKIADRLKRHWGGRRYREEDDDGVD